MPSQGDDLNYDSIIEHPRDYERVLREQYMIKELLDLVERAKPIVVSDAQMVADLTRFSPLPPEAQEKHDTTEYPSEKWLADLETFKKKWMIK